jgi:hypothetical protein
MALTVLAVVGCRSAPAPTDVPERDELVAMGLAAAEYVEAVDAVCVPPHGWRAEALKKTGDHAHQVWVSPRGDTAFGVIHFSLPLPLGHRFVLAQFLRQMRQSEGEAILLEEQWDADLHGIRFVAEGGLYRIHTNLLVRGFRGWAIYAGTRRDRPVMRGELDLAESARETTRVGRAKNQGDSAE